MKVFLYEEAYPDSALGEVPPVTRATYWRGNCDSSEQLRSQFLRLYRFERLTRGHRRTTRLPSGESGPGFLIRLPSVADERVAGHERPGKERTCS
jgi:hypothetical protein